MSAGTTGRRGALISSVRKRGLRRTAASLAARLPVMFGLHERHQWSILCRPDYHPGPPGKDDGAYEFVLATAADLPDLVVMGTSFTTAEQLLAQGQRLFIARRDGRPVFTVWAFAGRMPTNASPSGWIDLPPDTVNIEDSMAHPDVRGSGAAGFAWTRLLAALFADPDVQRVVTIMHESNVIVRRAAVRMAMREFATVDVRKRGIGRRPRNWRDRRADGPLLRNRVTVEQFTGAKLIPASDAAAEQTRWLRGLLDAG